MLCSFIFDFLSLKPANPFAGFFKEKHNKDQLLIVEEEEELDVRDLPDIDTRDLCIEYWVEQKAKNEKGMDVELTFLCEREIQRLLKTTGRKKK